MVHNKGGKNHLYASVKIVAAREPTDEEKRINLLLNLLHLFIDKMDDLVVGVQ